MINFGYKINIDRQIDLNQCDKRVEKFVSKIEPTFNTCIACGTCTTTCSAGNFTNFNPRLLYTLVKRGQIDDVKKEIEKCMLCGKCQLACPRGINTRHIILNIQKALEKLEKNEI